jgi:hypothetical protein
VIDHESGRGVSLLEFDHNLVAVRFEFSAVGLVAAILSDGDAVIARPVLSIQNDQEFPVRFWISA